MKESAQIALNWLRSNASMVSVYDWVKIHVLPNDLNVKRQCCLHSINHSHLNKDSSVLVTEVVVIVTCGMFV